MLYNDDNDDDDDDDDDNDDDYDEDDDDDDDDDNNNNNNNNKHFTCKTTLHVVQIVNTKQLQHSIPQKHGLFHVYNCKYPA